MSDSISGLHIKGSDPRKRFYLTPARVMKVWGGVENPDILTKNLPSQIAVENRDYTRLKNGPDGEKAAVLLDFGKEINGSIRVITWHITDPASPQKLHVRFGESVGEALTDIGINNTTNDHAMRDMYISVPNWSNTETNETGFRFVYIELCDPDSFVDIMAVEGILKIRDIKRIGNFECSDTLLNKIWETAVWTTHLNMQEYLWDGIKRDRLVWAGDTLTETRTILDTFGANEVLPLSFDYSRDFTLSNGWMNGMPSYSMWWILSQYRYYMASGDLGYLRQQKPYMLEILGRYESMISGEGKETVSGGHQFLDHFDLGKPDAIHSGHQGLLIMSLEKAEYLLDQMCEHDEAEKAASAAAKLRKYTPPLTDSKPAEGLTVAAGIRDAKETYDKLIGVGGARGFSAFLSLYTLEAFNMAGHFDEALKAIRDYWGGMLSIGATSFWEEFDVDWLENAARIDEFAEKDKIDVHGTYGSSCFVKYRHSLCHGWCSTPAPWMVEHVLGISVLEPGCRKIAVKPKLGGLDWANGAYPTPFGKVEVCHKKLSDGSLKTEISAPAGVEIVR
ncbi:MAG: alpha-L-rhamnosidase [Clostridiales bacterium]|nr:alpha-L-rhamnosidase [Clostridiales bacterium]